jgi:hypothetical protein
LQSHTSCGEAMVATGSAQRFALCKHNHIHAVEGKNSDSINNGTYTLHGQSHTRYKKVVIILVKGSILCKHNHIHACGKAIMMGSVWGPVS